MKYRITARFVDYKEAIVDIPFTPEDIDYRTDKGAAAWEALEAAAAEVKEWQNESGWIDEVVDVNLEPVK